jgi:hypothetical protein
MSVIPEHLRKVNVFVYAIGKTGSTTLEETMLRNGFQCLHVHNNWHYQTHILKNTSHTLNDLLEYSVQNHKRVYIIDVYRNPIERKISSFFHNFKIWLPQNQNLSLNNVRDIFHATINEHIKDYSPFHNVCEHFNIPVPEGFDFQKGYLRVDFKNITLIKLRFASINKWSTILSEIFEKPIRMCDANVTKNKHYYVAQQEFLKFYTPTPELLEEIEKDAYFQYFNTSQEQEEYIQKWKSKLNL